MLDVDTRRKGYLGEDIREHVGGGAPSDRESSLRGEVENIMVLDVDVLRLQVGHVVGAEIDVTLIIHIYMGR